MRMAQLIRELITSKPVGSLDVEIGLKPSKNKDQAVKTIINKRPVHKNFLFLGCSYHGHKSYDQKQILDLKKQKKRYLKQLVRQNYLVSTPNQSIFILKNLGKILQLYNKTPNLIDISDENVQLISRKSYYRLKDNRLQGKIGKTTEDISILTERLSDLINEFQDRISYVMIKTTHSKPFYDTFKD